MDVSQTTELVSGAELGRRLGMSRQAISKARKAGRVSASSDGFDPENAAAEIAENTDQSQVRRPAAAEHRASGIPPFAQSRAMREHIAAKKAALDYQKEVGALVDRARVEKAAFDRARAEREAWLNWPVRISASLAAEVGCDERLLRAALERLVREQLASRSEHKPIVAQP